MVVKVMWARALRPQEQEAPAATPVDRAGARARTADARKAPEKPKRRRSAVYDAEGNEVFITLLCLKCHKTRPLSQFGLRRMADGAIRNQPWCRACRSEASPRKRAEDRSEKAPVAVAALEPAAGAPRDAGLLAAQVAAALQRGRG